MYLPWPQEQATKSQDPVSSSEAGKIFTYFTALFILNKEWLIFLFLFIIWTYTAQTIHSLLGLGRYAVSTEKTVCVLHGVHIPLCSESVVRSWRCWRLCCPHVAKPIILPTVKQQLLPFIAAGKGFHRGYSSLSCVYRKNHRPYCGITGPNMPRCVPRGQLFSAFLRSTYKVFCLIGFVFMCACVCRYTHLDMLCAGYTWLCTYVWRPEVNIRCCLIKLSTF